MAEPITLDPTPDPTATWEVIVITEHGQVLARPLPPGQTTIPSRGLTYHQHTCPTTLPPQ